MESLSIVATIARIAQDIAGAVATVSRNRSRCRKLAERVQGIGDLLRELHGSGAGAAAGTTDSATRRLLDRLEIALRRALQVVQSCRDSSCPLNLLAGGRQAERLDEVDGEIDRCLLDLGSVANRILIARLEKLLLQNVVRNRDPASTGVKDDGDKDDDSKTEKVAAPAESGSDKKNEPVPTGGGERKDKDKTAAGAGAGNVTIGVPVSTVNAGMHELVPPPSYCHWPYAQGFFIDGVGYYHDGAGAPSGAAAYYHHHHWPYPEVPDMFSDENPNACAVI